MKTLALALACTALSSTTLFAQTTVDASGQTTENGPKEIIVTARRTGENILDVPISIIAVSGDELNEKNVKTANDLSFVAPGLSIQNTSSNRATTTFSMRGQGQTFGQIAPGVVAYMAEVPIPEGSSGQFYDLENIQVLKGPPGTLFGRNASGGAILFTPKKPGNEFNGYVIGRLGDYGRQDVEFAAGGAIAEDVVQVRLAGQFLHRNGFTTNLFDGGKLDNEDRKSVRFSVVVTPFEGFENHTIFSYAKFDDDGSGQSLGGIVEDNPTFLLPGTFTGVPLLPALQDALAAQEQRGPRVVDLDWPTHNGLRSRDLINITTFDVTNSITLKNIFSYSWYKYEYLRDLDGSPLPVLGVSNPFQSNWINQRTEEIQLRGVFGIVEGVVGYYDERYDTEAGSVGFDTEQYIAAPLGPVFTYVGPIGAINVAAGSLNTSKAFYGEFNLQPVDDLTLTAGIRQTRDFRSSSQLGTTLTFPDAFGPGADLVIPGTPNESSGKFKATTWNLAGLYEFTPDLSAYATVRRGYKSGGVNGTAIDPADQLFAPEYVTDYEIGVKSRFNLGSVDVFANLDYFYDDYTNIQRFLNLNTVPASTVTRNAAKGSIQGIDLEIGLQSRLFDITAGYSYLDAKYDEYIDPTRGDLSNSDFPNTPEHQLTVAPKFKFPVPDDIGEVSFLANIYARSKIAFDPINKPNGNPITDLSPPGAIGAGYTRVDLRLDWKRVAGSQFSAALFMRNAFDEEYIVGSNNQLPTQFASVSYLYGEPRTFGGEIRFDF